MKLLRWDGVLLLLNMRLFRNRLAHRSSFLNAIGPQEHTHTSDLRTRLCLNWEDECISLRVVIKGGEWSGASGAGRSLGRHVGSRYVVGNSLGSYANARMWAQAWQQHAARTERHYAARIYHRAGLLARLLARPLARSSTHQMTFDYTPPSIPPFLLPSFQPPSTVA